jgi:uncharacterized phage protein (TIGR02220 family)
MNPIIIQTIDYLNEVAGTYFVPDHLATTQELSRLLDMGYTLEDFKKVIRNKWSEWQGTEYQEFMRPSTLFGKKFQYYLNAKPRIAKSGLYKLADAVQQAKSSYRGMDNNPRGNDVGKHQDGETNREL